MKNRRRLTLTALAAAAAAITMAMSTGVASANFETTTSTTVPEETTTTTLPECPPNYYDGVLPEDGGTGPVWPEGEPTGDCQGGTIPVPEGSSTTLVCSEPDGVCGPDPATPTAVAPSFTG